MNRYKNPDLQISMETETIIMKLRADLPIL